MTRDIRNKLYDSVDVFLQDQTTELVDCHLINTGAVGGTGIVADGPLSALTNSLILRKNDGTMKNIMLVFDNGGISERSQIVTYPTKVPSGTYAFRATKQFSDNNGVVIRLQHGECIEVVVQDNLINTDFDKFACLVHGHVVEE